MLINRLEDVVNTMWLHDPIASDYVALDEYEAYLLSKYEDTIKNDLTKAEVDVLSSLSDLNKKMKYYAIIRNLIECGWFAGVINTDDTVSNILDNYNLIGE